MTDTGPNPSPFLRIPCELQLPMRCAFRRTSTDPLLDGVIVGAVIDGSLLPMQPSHRPRLQVTPDNVDRILLVVVDAEVWEAQSNDELAAVILALWNGMDPRERWAFTLWDWHRFWELHTRAADLARPREIAYPEPRSRKEAVFVEAGKAELEKAGEPEDPAVVAGDPAHGAPGYEPSVTMGELEAERRKRRNATDARNRAELEAESAKADLRLAMREIEELRALVVRQALELARRGCP